MKNLTIIFFTIFFIASCTKVGEPSYHPSNWIEPESDNSHMAKIAEIGTEWCQSCHGGTEKNDYFGGTSGVSCYDCHEGGPGGHPAFNIWVGSPNSSDFHGKDDVLRCRSCHGTNSDGGISGVSCYTCHDGPAGYGCGDFDPPITHSILLEKDNCEALHKPGYENPIDNSCTNCHGLDLTGDWLAPSCYTCHSNRWDENENDD